MSGKMVSTVHGKAYVLNLMYLVGFLDLFGVSLVIPLLSHHLTKTLGASATAVGMLWSFYGGLQLVSGPIVGRWSDVSGRRYTLVICLFVSAMSYFGIGMASVLYVAFLVRIPIGIFKHSLSIAKAYIADIVPKDEQLKAFGNFNAYSSIGFIVGPPVGGHLGDLPGGFYTVACLCGILFLINGAQTSVLVGHVFLGIVYWFVPECEKQSPHPELVRDESVPSLRQVASEEINFSPLQFLRSFHGFNWTALWDIFTLRFLLSFSFLIYRSNYSLILINNYGATPKIIGYIISYSAIISAGSGFLCGRLAKRYSNQDKLLLHGILVMICAMMAATLSPNLTTFLVCSTPLSISNAITRICITDITIRKGHGHDNGALLGLAQSIVSIARIIAPTLAGILLEASMYGPGIMASTLCLVCVFIMFLYPLDRVVGKQKAQ